MQSQMTLLQPVLDLPYIRKTRRNHGLEHATIHLLSQRVPGLRCVGRSDSGGFWLWGEVKTEDVEACAAGALRRMRGGEHGLAIHPNCGTNLLTVAVLGTAATLLALVGSERERFGKLNRAPLVATGILFAAIFGQPLGMRVQQYVTTLGDPGEMEIVEIKRSIQAGVVAHRVRTTLG